MYVGVLDIVIITQKTLTEFHLLLALDVKVVELMMEKLRLIFKEPLLQCTTNSR
jgi:hypothetical protein